MKTQTKFIISLSILVILVGAGAFGYTLHINAVKAERQKQLAAKNAQLIQTAKQGVNDLYTNERKEALASDLSEQKIKQAYDQVKLVKDNKIKSSLNTELSHIASLFHFQAMIDGLLIDGIIVNDVDTAQITSMNADFKNAKDMNAKIASIFNEKVETINSQFNTIQNATKKVQSLFTNTHMTTVKADVSKNQYIDAKKLVDTIKNMKAKNSLKVLLDKVNNMLTAKEKAESQTVQATSNSQKEKAVSTDSQKQTASRSTSNTKVAETGLAAIVARSNTAAKTNQIVTVVANGTSAQVTLFEKSNGTWEELITTSGHVGSQGVGKASEGSARTPIGSYSLGFAFGTSNPGTQLPFRKITPHSYWISNVKDSQYNTWQERSSSSKYDEHLADYPVQYRYAIVINYHNGVGGGSGFFLHCDNGIPTAGCVSVPTSVMAQLMKRIHSGAYIINANSQSSIANY